MIGSTIRSLFFVTVVCVGLAWLLRENTGGLFNRDGAQDAHAAAQPAASVARAQPSPPAANTLNDRELLIEADRTGHFVLDATVGPALVPFMVDTGATIVALSRADAERIGFAPSRLDFKQTVQTANGVARVAPVTLDSITIGQLTVRDVRAVVIDQPMSISLLGMSFLSRLNGYEVRDRRLVLRW